MYTRRGTARGDLGYGVDVFRFSEPLSEQEVGVRAARERLPALLSAVDQGNHVIHMTRHGKRVAALVSTNVAEGVVAIWGSEGPAFPGDLAGVIKLVESTLIDNEDAPRPNIKMIDSKRNELVGAAIILIDLLVVAPELSHGVLDIVSDDGTIEKKAIADVLVRTLHNQPTMQAMNPSPLPIIAGCLWSAQLGGSVADYRLTVPTELGPIEALAWIITLWEICLLVNLIHGEGVAENLMYEFEEIIREQLSTWSEASVSTTE